MATVVKIVLTVLTAGYVLSQSTTDDSELPLNIQIQLQLTTLEYQHQQLAEVLNDLLEHQQQQLKKLNELQTMLTNRLGKLCNILHADFGHNLLKLTDACSLRKFGKFSAILTKD